MADPRYVIPGQTYLLTRRCLLRTFRLRPGPLTNRIVLYALAFAASKTGVQVHAICVMSDHLHALVSDPLGRLPDFLREFHRSVAKALNAAQGQWESLWNTEKANALPIADDYAVVDRIAYVVTNPVKDGLVRRPEDWPGVLLWKPCDFTVQRPEVYFAEGGECPAELVLRVVRPPRPAWSEREWTAELERAIERRVRLAHARMAEEGRAFVGRDGVLSSSFLRRAKSHELKREPIPKVAATETRAKKILEFIRKSFLVAYREALREWRAKLREVVFPTGTWWMVRHHAAAVATSSPDG
jgi:putative transposase